MTNTAPRSGSAARGSGGAANSGRKFTADIIKQLKEMTDAGDDEIQVALSECNGDVNRAAMSLLENPFQAVKNKKLKPKPTEKPPVRAAPRDFPRREGGYTRDREPDRYSGPPGGRGGRGSGRDSDRGRGGRGGRGRLPPRDEVSAPIAPGTRPPLAEAPEIGDAAYQPTPKPELLVVPTTVPVAAAPPSPARPLVSSVDGAGGSWASKLKETKPAPPPPAPAPVEPEEPEPVHHELLTSNENGWGMPEPAVVEPAEEPLAEEHETDAFGNGFGTGHDAENAGPSWGPPAPGDGSAQWGTSTDMPSAALEDAVGKSFDSTPPGMPKQAPAPAAYNHNATQQVFDLSSMASSLGGNYGADKNFANFGLPKDAAPESIPASSYAQPSMPAPQQQSMGYSNFAQSFADSVPAPADDDTTAPYAMPQVPGFSGYNPPQQYMPADHSQYGLAEQHGGMKQHLNTYASHDSKKDEFSLSRAGLPEKVDAGEGKASDHASQSSQSHMQAQQTQQPRQHQQQQQQQDMTHYGMLQPTPDMYSINQRPGGAQQQQPPQQQQQQQPGGMMQPLGMQQNQNQQQQMPGFMPQQPGMAGYPGAGYPGMQYGSQLGYQQGYGMPQYGGMAGYPGAFPGYPGFPQPSQNYPGQAQQAQYGAAPTSYTAGGGGGGGGKPAYDAGFGTTSAGRNGGRRGKKSNFGGRGGGGAGAGGASAQAQVQAHSLPSEPFNHTQPAPVGGTFSGYTDPSQWSGNMRFDTAGTAGGVSGGYKPDKAGAAGQQFDQSAYMQQPQQNFQQFNSFQGQQYQQPYAGQQSWGGQDKTGAYQKPF